MDVLRATPEEIAAVTASRTAQGLLPPIAGGGGVWRLNVNAQKEETVGKKITELASSFSQNLLSESSPTLMEEWQITDIRVPVAAFTIVEAASLSISLNLYYGEELVWSQSERVEKTIGRVTPVFAQNFNQPISVRRGRGLRLEMSGAVVFTKEEAEGTLYTFMAYTGGASNQTVIPSQGKVTYNSINLSGHRTL